MSAPTLPAEVRAAFPDAAQIVRLWPLANRKPAGHRVLGFLLALDGTDALRYPLGTRNQRLLALHETLARRPLEARSTCPACGTDNEFPLPTRAIADLPRPQPDAVATLTVDGTPHTFRLPVLADLADGPSGLGGLAGLAERTCLHPPAPRLTAQDLERLAAGWGVLDPAGSLRIQLSCAGCGRELAADADPAEFVARDFDLLVDRLLREVDLIAARYGWAEDAILALPPARRRRYLEIITESRSPAAAR